MFMTRTLALPPSRAGLELYVIGFSDGHVTDYEAATQAPLKILRWVEFGFVFLFLAFAFLPMGARAPSDCSWP
jgi:hypothetical protein